MQVYWFPFTRMFLLVLNVDKAFFLINIQQLLNVDKILYLKSIFQLRYKKI